MSHGIDVNVQTRAGRHLDFDRGEYELRIRRLRDAMRVENLDGLLVTQPEHMVYLFGYLPTAAMFQAGYLPMDSEPELLVRQLDLSTFRNCSWVEETTIFRDSEDPVAVMTELLAARGVRRVGVENDSNVLTVARHQQISAALPAVDLIDFSGVLWEQRLVKSRAELDYLSRAAKIAGKALASGVAATASGVSERVPVATAYAEALRLGADNGRVLLAGAGDRSADLHGQVGDHVLQDGDVLHLELVPQFRGYSARTMRPTVIGEPSEFVRRTVADLYAIQDDQMAAMRPGADAADVDAVARKPMIDRVDTGYPNVTGYTLGLHAQPRTSDFTRVFHERAQWRLEPGMVFHMYLAAHGLAISETVAVTDTGARRLTGLPRRLYIR